MWTPPPKQGRRQFTKLAPLPGTADAILNPALLEIPGSVYIDLSESADAISPWFVQSYGNSSKKSDYQLVVSLRQAD